MANLVENFLLGNFGVFGLLSAQHIPLPIANLIQDFLLDDSGVLGLVNALPPILRALLHFLRVVLQQPQGLQSRDDALAVAVSVDRMSVKADLAQELAAAPIRAFGHQMLIDRLLDDDDILVVVFVIASDRFVDVAAAPLTESVDEDVREEAGVSPGRRVVQPYRQMSGEIVQRPMIFSGLSDDDVADEMQSGFQLIFPPFDHFRLDNFRRRFDRRLDGGGLRLGLGGGLGGSGLWLGLGGGLAGGGLWLGQGGVLGGSGSSGGSSGESGRSGVGI